MSYSKTTYTGPVQVRGTDSQGRALVSREELADFRRKYGADKTLRDLLNADRSGKLPEVSSERDMRARGVQGANISPAKEALKRAVIPGAPASQAEPITPTMGSRLLSGLSDTAQKALAATGIAAGVGGLSYAALRAKRAADAAKAAKELRKLEVPAYAAAKRAEANERAMSSMKEGLAKDLAKDMSSGSMGRGTPMRSTATTSDTGRRFTPDQEMEAATSAARGAAGRKTVQEARARTGRSQATAEAKAEKPILRTEKAKETPRSRTRDKEDVDFKKGGKVKAYAKGGSVRGAGIAQRGLRKCKVF